MPRDRPELVLRVALSLQILLPLIVATTGICSDRLPDRSGAARLGRDVPLQVSLFASPSETAAPPSGLLIGPVVRVDDGRFGSSPARLHRND